MEISNYKEYLFETAKKIFAIDSPSGYYFNVTEEVRRIAEELGYSFERIEKGCGIITVDGQQQNRSSFCPCRYFGLNGTFHYFQRRPEIYLRWRPNFANPGR